MDAAQVLDELSLPGDLPMEALRAADADRAGMLPLVLQALEQFSQGVSTAAERRRLFWIFHLLGQWQEKTAYLPLAGLLRGPRPTSSRTPSAWRSTTPSLG